MKHFLHWSCSFIGGIMIMFAYRAYGVWGFVGCLCCVIYLMLAQWHEGRYCR